MFPIAPELNSQPFPVVGADIFAQVYKEYPVFVDQKLYFPSQKAFSWMVVQVPVCEYLLENVWILLTQNVFGRNEVRSFMRVDPEIA